MTESMWTVTIQFVLGPVAVLVVGWILNRKLKNTNERIEKTKKEITNSHPQHLRDDLDAKFKLVFAKLDTNASMIGSIDTKLDDHIIKYKEDASTVFTTLADHEGRLTGQAGKLRRVAKSK